MRRIILLLTLVGATLLACSGVVLAQDSTDNKKAPVQEEDQDAIQSQYIVVLKDNIGRAKDVADKHANKANYGQARLRACAEGLLRQVLGCATGRGAIRTRGRIHL